jgi:DNA repair protein RadC
MSTPLDKLKRDGAGALGPIELLAVVLTHTDDDSLLHMKDAQNLLESQFGSIRNLARFAETTLSRYLPNQLDAFRIQAAIELGRRSREAKLIKDVDMSSPDEVYQLFAHLADEPQEQVWVALLDVKNRLILRAKLHVGTLDSSVVGIRDVFREALRVNAASIILVHNHPSGDPTPSPEDIELTKRMAAAGKQLESELVDHVIVGSDGFTSLRRLGYLG